MKLDWTLIFIISILYSIGLSLFYNITFSTGNQILFYKFLVGNIILPISIFFIFSLIKWNALRKIILILFIINIIFLILAFLPIFKLPGQNTARWFHLKFISFQPSEFIKLTTLLFLSFSIKSIRKERDHFLISFLIVSLIAFVIFKQPAYTNLLIFLISLIGAFFSIKFDFKILLFVLLILGLISVASLTQEYRIKRIIGIMTGDEENIGYQLKQTRTAISSGGLFGKGLGNSEFKIIGIPLMFSDTLFAIYAEENGFIGSLFLIILFLILTIKIFYKGNLVKNEEKKFFAYGVGCWISSQAFIHIISNILITTGVPLPFLSYGPSSQISIMAALGLINSLENS